LKINRGIAVGLAVLMGAGMFVHWRTRDFDNAQAANDRETVDCLTGKLARSEKQRIARLTAAHDGEAIRVAYLGILPRCVVRRDQLARSDLLIRGARQVLKYDPEFQRMLAASSLVAAQQ
jgi:hypothetical protein